MSGSRDALRERLLATFRVEAREHVSALGSALIDLERAGGGETRRLIELAFREAHSLKGAARAVSLTQVESVCQGMETIFSALKRESLMYSRELADILLSAVRVLEQLLEAAEQGTVTVPSQATASTLSALRRAASAAAAAPGPGTAAAAAAPSAETVPRTPPAPAISEAAAPSSAPGAPSSERPPASGAADRNLAGELVRVPIGRLDRVWLRAEELVAEKLALLRQLEEIRELLHEVTTFRARWSRAAGELRRTGSAREQLEGARSNARLRADAIDVFVDETLSFAERLEHHGVGLRRGAEQNHRALTAKCDALIEESRGLLMLPCSWLLSGMRLAVRDLARDQGKDIDFAFEGESIEIDRRILSELKAPLLHMLRNAVDHGVEPPSERLRAGKPAQAKLSVRISQISGRRVSLRVTDDGRGIDTEKVKQAAVRLGAVDALSAEALPRERVLELVFASEVSTSALITDVSGRGLGMAIVRDKVQQLGGAVTIQSEPSRGTTLELLLPISLATFRGVLVRAGDQFCVLPTLSVARVLRVARTARKSVENRAVVEDAGRPIPLVPLSRVLGLSGEPGRVEGAWLSLVVVNTAAGRIALSVDEVCQEQDVLVKPLGEQLEGLPGVVGATVLSTGRIALVLDVADVGARALSLESAGSDEPAQTTDPSRKRSILVAEDSITSRTLLKSILESAGFHVTTAVDGADAFVKLKTGEFDLVVSDVDMPRLNGLGLTQRIRADRALSELPVVLVTSLESREDKERGIEVGANAYIVKRSFEQSNLLEVVQRLI